MFNAPSICPGTPETQWLKKRRTYILKRREPESLFGISITCKNL